MKILKRREHHQETTYRLGFEHVNSPGSGFSFPCDKDGDTSDLGPEAARESLRQCLTGSVRMADGKISQVKALGVSEHTHSYNEPAIGECNHCGAEVCLSGFTNTCDCGTDYNMSGQELAPREQWGEETGESLADILSIP